MQLPRTATLASAASIALLGLAYLYLTAGDSSNEVARLSTSDAASGNPGGGEIITGIAFDTTTLNRYANGSDIWPITYSDDGYLYAAGGDGVGWDTVDTRGLMVVRLDLPDPSGTLLSAGTELYSRAGVLPAGIISVDGILYMIEVERGNGFQRGRIGRSTDHGVTWNYRRNAENSWDVRNLAFSQGHFVNYGQDYSSARDEYVYITGGEDFGGGDDGNALYDQMVLARVARNSVQDVSKWQYFDGTSSSPSWSRKFGDRTPIFSRPAEIHWAATVNYNTVLDRYLLVFFTNYTGNLAVYEGPEPWGPWTRIHEAQFMGGTTDLYGMTFVNAPGWLSADGREWWFVVTGDEAWDSFNTMRATLTVDGH